MTLVVVLAAWFVLLPAGGLLCARVLRFGERPSTPWDAWDVDASGAPLAADTPLRATVGR